MGCGTTIEEKYPELAWDLIAKRPARIALASTLNRVRIIKTEPQLEFIRSHRDDPHEFNRAQVAIALGYNGDPQDLQYLRVMGDGVNHYVAQSAVTALSLFGGEQARRALSELEEKHRGNPRGVLISQLLREAYDWPPFKTRYPKQVSEASLSLDARGCSSKAAVPANLNSCDS